MRFVGWTKAALTTTRPRPACLDGESDSALGRPLAESASPARRARGGRTVVRHSVLAGESCSPAGQARRGPIGPSRYLAQVPKLIKKNAFSACHGRIDGRHEPPGMFVKQPLEFRFGFLQSPAV